MIFEINKVVRDENNIVLAIPINGIFKTTNKTVIKQLQDLGYKEFNPKPSKTKKKEIKK